MIDVFISYKREDRIRARVIAELLAKEGYKIWWDVELLPGDNFAEEINKIISKAKATVVLWTPESLESAWVKSEASVALNKKTLIPILLKNTDIPVPFNGLQTLDLTIWSGEESSKCLRPLVDAVKKKVGKSNRGKKHFSPQEIDNILERPGVEVAYWNSISYKNEVHEYKLYIKEYGENAIFTKLAHERIDVLEKKGDIKPFGFAAWLKSNKIYIEVLSLIITILTALSWIANYYGVFETDHDIIFSNANKEEIIPSPQEDVDEKKYWCDGLERPDDTPAVFKNKSQCWVQR